MHLRPQIILWRELRDSDWTYGYADGGKGGKWEQWEEDGSAATGEWSAHLSLNSSLELELEFWNLSWCRVLWGCVRLCSSTQRAS